jgi:hypothetical protein
MDCPIMEGIPCRMGKCAWYNLDLKRCAIVVIADSLMNFNESVAIENILKVYK